MLSGTMRLFAAALIAGLLVWVGVSNEPADASTRQLALGVSEVVDPGATVKQQWQQVQDFISSTGGLVPATWSIWRDWAGPSSQTAFPKRGFLDDLYSKGITPVIFWQPTGITSTGVEANKYFNIIKKKFDAYITQWAMAAKNWGHTIILRFAHEMDGSWFPWSVKKYGNSPDRFVKAWKHIWQIFHDVGATNVRFMWSPLDPCACRADLYPGDQYVDYVGFTALNWGAGITQGSHPGWRSLISIVKERMQSLPRLTKKPVIIAELASSAVGGNRPFWITKGYNDLYKKYPQIVGMMYLNVDMTRFENQPDWRLALPHDNSALSAYAALMASKPFKGKIK
jgi:Glycosyl hydrolase family 26